ncbi:hypothetical protein Pmani_018886 [Petrolisthes manimaculis]|uniref:Uncharacterized protein n=1 Tax=Petrolisthes manimaculis TaxID=1843537 RepID=A0AAE1U8A5_9EUCA|nr:hypothetical protein Pmani_018886 [Petrolisthes manimaculis]
MGKGTEIRNGHMNPEQNNQMTEENRWCGPGVRRGTCGQVGVGGQETTDSLPHITQLPSLTSPPPPPSQQPATLPNITLPSSLTTTQHHLALLPHNTVSHHSPPPSHHPATLTHPLVSLTSHHFALLTPGFYMSPGPTDAWAPTHHLSIHNTYVESDTSPEELTSDGTEGPVMPVVKWLFGVQAGGTSASVNPNAEGVECSG